MPHPAGAAHGGYAMDLGSRIASHVRENGLGRVFAAETGFVLSDETSTVRAPDVAFVAAERLPPAGLPAGYLPFAPDLAVEIASPSNRASDLEQTVLDFLDAGTRLLRVVDPDTRTVTVYRSRDDVRVRRAGEALDGEDVLPGFRIEVATVFGGSAVVTARGGARPRRTRARAATLAGCDARSAPTTSLAR